MSVVDEMRQVMADHPELTDFGFGIYFMHRRLPRAEREAQFRKDRADLLEPRSIEAFALARDWLSRYPKRKTMNDRGTSYGLKHVAEKDIGYSTNGVFIAAAIAEGFKVKPSDLGSPNALLNISSEAWK